MLNSSTPCAHRRQRTTAFSPDHRAVVAAPRTALRCSRAVTASPSSTRSAFRRLRRGSRLLFQTTRRARGDRPMAGRSRAKVRERDPEQAAQHGADCASVHEQLLSSGCNARSFFRHHFARVLGPNRCRAREPGDCPGVTPAYGNVPAPDADPRAERHSPHGSACSCPRSQTG